MCITPFYKDGMPLPCGKCPDCKSRRISGWSFRLMKEAERSSSAFFVTLTYDPEHCRIDGNGMMTLLKSDLQTFFKALRKLNRNKLKYYACGEYGTDSWRPHYHVILFNAELHTLVGTTAAFDMKRKRIPIDGTYQCRCEAWPHGHVTVGQVTEASVGYTLKYITKPSRIKGHGNWDERLPEFALMSKGLGDNYLTDSAKKWHKEHGKIAERVYITRKGGEKISMPRYYKDKIYSKGQRLMIGLVGESVKKKQDEEKTVDEMLKEDKIKIEKLRRYGKDNRTTKKDV